jgi:hypothetical protein
MDRGADINSRVTFEGIVMQMALRSGYEPAGRHLVERRVERVDVDAQIFGCDVCMFTQKVVRLSNLDLG